MKIKRVLNIEDTILKHSAISRSLKKLRITEVDLAETAEDGIAKIELALKEDNPYELLISDMEFPVNGVLQSDAGMYVINELKKREIEIPIVVCSSLRYRIPEIEGCIHYKENSGDLDGDVRGFVQSIERR